MKADLIQKATDVLRANDMGDYTVPTRGLYPFQWNWDSCLTALGFAKFDEARAWREIDTLFKHQWEDGMVPHIVFHKEDDGYFPGPDVWGVNRSVPTSGITQPPIAGFVVKMLADRAQDRGLAHLMVKRLLPKIARWHDWFYDHRDPDDQGLVAVLHPWETGRDNSADWDDAFSRVPTDGVQSFVRRDTQHANPHHRPTEEQYKRYIWLVKKFRSLGWDNTKLHAASPFQIVDPGFNAILLRSIHEIGALAQQIGEDAIAEKSRKQHLRGIAALESLWSEDYQQYLCFDRLADKVVDSPSVAGILPVFASSVYAQQIATRLRGIRASCNYLVPSHDPASPAFDELRYWRGPVWLIVNFLIQDGLKRAGETQIAQQIIQDSLALIEKSGFAEYYGSIAAAPCGGGRFTWTAAMVIEFLSKAGANQTQE